MIKTSSSSFSFYRDQNHQKSHDTFPLCDLLFQPTTSKVSFCPPPPPPDTYCAKDPPLHINHYFHFEESQQRCYSVTQHIPTMTKSHHGGNMSVMIKVGICQCQNPTIYDEVQLGPVGSGKLFNMPPVLRHNISAQLGPSDRTQ